jgi:hypothetical protein
MSEIPNTVFGLMALIIVSLAGVVIRLYIQNSALYKQIIDIQEQRVVDSRETRDRLGEPLQQIAQYTKLTYDKLTSK